MRFTPREEEVLRAVVDRICPADDHPGAWDAGAADYLGRQLDGDLLPMRAIVRDGLAALDAAAHARSSVGFAALSSDAQDALLREIEATDFFVLLVRTTAEGFYGEPGQGGNRDAVSWVMTGFGRDPA
jgi:hypothetical protein